MMRTFFLAAATAAAPAALHAQQPAPPVIAVRGTVAVVDIDHIFRTCAQCRVASAALQAQAEAFQARAVQLSDVLQTEGRALEALVGALSAGSQPDAALRARLEAFQTNRSNAEREFAQVRDRLQRVVESVRDQIQERMQPALATAMRQHGATSFVERGSSADTGGRIDITGEVLAIIDQNPEPFDLHAPRAADPDRRP